jgi:ABC-type nitrate/sulfonate/bicarbonate transport system permease component
VSEAEATEPPVALAAQSPHRRRWLSKQRVTSLGWPALSGAAIGLLIALWWLVTHFQWVSPHELPSISGMVDTYRTLVTQGYNGVPLEDHLYGSLKRCVIGFTIGASIGVPLGLLSGYYRAVSAVVSPIVALLRPVPPIAYLPLLVTFLGIGEEPKIFLIAAGAFFYMLLNTAAGVRSVPETMVQAGRMLGLTQRQIFTSIIVRAALPQILTGINIALVISWAIVVAAELVASDRGLGFIALNAAQLYQINYVYASVILIGAIGALFELGVRRLERILVPWVGK